MLQKTRTITPFELKRQLDNNNDFLIIDVREKMEYEICNIGGALIPLNLIPTCTELIPKDRPVVFVCHHGVRSEMAVKHLQENFAYENLYNLEGGIDEWANVIDTKLATY
ncbi:MAG: rhodanese-related sulfurtransferase [Sphingobacteriales bacterium]|jgi:rhodanese-related sulfurtransferase